MSNADSCLTGLSIRFSDLKKPLFFLSLVACMSFAPANNRPAVKPAAAEATTYTYKNRTEDSRVMTLREWVTGYAQNFTGIRYRYAGRSPKTGFDCSGFTSYILKEFDLSVSSSSATQSTQGARISLDEVLPGDLVFFGSKKHIQHVALVVECSAEGIICVHSTCSRGVVVENISTSKYWRPRILFARDVITGQARGSRALPALEEEHCDDMVACDDDCDTECKD